MAKKVKKSVKKTSSVTSAKKHHHHHWHPHEFFIVVAGGFIVIVLILIFSNGFRSEKSVSNDQSYMESQMSEEGLPEATVTIEEFSYSPNPLRVKVGTTVTWTNNDSEPHSATADDGIFNTGTLDQGQSGSVTFTKAGAYTYHCSFHPNMTGTVIVEE